MPIGFFVALLTGGWKDFRTALLATAMTLGCFIVWHIVRLPWLTHKSIGEEGGFLAGAFGILVITGVLAGGIELGRTTWAARPAPIPPIVKIEPPPPPFPQTKIETKIEHDTKYVPVPVAQEKPDEPLKWATGIHGIWSDPNRPGLWPNELLLIPSKPVQPVTCELTFGSGVSQVLVDVVGVGYMFGDNLGPNLKIEGGKTISFAVTQPPIDHPLRLIVYSKVNAQAQKISYDCR